MEGRSDQIVMTVEDSWDCNKGTKIHRSMPLLFRMHHYTMARADDSLDIIRALGVAVLLFQME